MRFRRLRISDLRRSVFEVRQVDRAGPVHQAVLQGADVAAVQAARGENGADGAGHGEPENRRRLHGRREQHDKPNEPAADRVAEAIERHVDERLRRPFLRGGNRRVEQLVARPEPGAAEDRLAAARQRRGCRIPARRGWPRLPDSSAADGVLVVSRQPEPLEHRPARGRLQDERDEAGRRVVERKEAEQMIAAAEGLDRLGLEQVVDQSGARRAEQDQRGKMPEVRRLGDDAQAGAGRFAAGHRRRARRRPPLQRRGRVADEPRRRQTAAPRGAAASNGAPNTTATRSATRALSSPPSVPAPAIWPNRFLAVRGSNRSLAISQKPDASSGPAPDMCR